MAGKVSHSSGVGSSNPIEALGNAGKAVAQETAQISADFAREAWDQLFASLRGEEITETPKKGVLHAGESIVFNKKKTAEQPKAEKQHRPDAAPAYNYFAETFRTVNNSERLTRRESSEMQQKIQEISVELRRLVSSSTILQEEFKEVTMSEAPRTPGEYHLNFFDWVLTVIRAARMKVEDSGAWLASMKGKKGKQSYWGMFKKHGTSFGLSSERSTATQTG